MLAKGPSFLQLPGEIRNQIYEHVLGNQHFHIESTKSRSHHAELTHLLCSNSINPNHLLSLSCPHSWHSAYHQSSRLHKHLLTLLRTAKCIHAEARLVLYRTSVFIIADSATFALALTSWPLGLLQNIRHLTLVFGNRWMSSSSSSSSSPRWAWHAVLKRRDTIVSSLSGLRSLHLVNKIGGAMTLRACEESSGERVRVPPSPGRGSDAARLEELLRVFEFEWAGEWPAGAGGKRGVTLWDLYMGFKHFGALEMLREVR
ncbi:hypothetical protein GTA08_BOTSDO09204 [Botryosphaeria dothidea]|uniref:DUF7730 domain-containing protein n=1 Tax=Botryosphaeria dothidea TaxID=55169 RepID=A0A8H4IKZ7_9PEZI|nr:hypothetical protein GTA08_BOTSDO09204 [Botryosphaeria dothidea]